MIRKSKKEKELLQIQKEMVNFPEKFDDEYFWDVSKKLKEIYNRKLRRSAKRIKLRKTKT